MKRGYVFIKSDYETEPLLTLPNYTESDYDSSVLLRHVWYCVFRSMRVRDSALRTPFRCTKATPVHYDLEHVRRVLKYDYRAGKAVPFEERHIYRLVLPEGEAWPMGSKKSWRFDQWRSAGQVYPIEFVETVALTRKQHISLIEKQIIRG